MSAPAVPIAKRAADWFGAARANPLFAFGLAGAAAVALADQAIKHWIVEIVRLPARVKIELSPIFDLTFVRNYGASFGLLAGGTASRIILSAIAIAVSAALIAWLARIDRKILAAAVALIVGGAVGNLVDRLRFGYVVDFLDFSGLYFPWVFNLADASINVGVGLILLDAWLRREKRPKSP
jgi:signal peptidase II